MPENGYAEALSGPEDAPLVLDDLKLWTGNAAILVIVAYSLPLAGIVGGGGAFGPGGGAYAMLVDGRELAGRHAVDAIGGVIA